MSDANRLRAAWGRLSYQVAIENDDFYSTQRVVFPLIQRAAVSQMLAVIVVAVVVAVVVIEQQQQQ